jgi:hypothetical protein
MKKSIDIQWMPMTTKARELFPELNVIYFKPESAIKYFLDLKKEQEYVKCPAFIDYLKNAFIIKCPYDIHIKVENGQVTTNVFDQQFFDLNIVSKFQSDGSCILQLMPRYLFITDHKNPIKIISTEVPLIGIKNNFRIIPGQFDITKWVRTINYCIEVPDNTTLILTRGEPLFMVKFDCEETVSLNLGVLTNDIQELTYGLVSVKKTVPNMSLKNLYEMADEYVTFMKKRIFNKTER